MKYLKTICVLAVVVSVGAGKGIASGQMMQTRDGISATGSAESTASAEFMRMDLTLQAKGSTLKDAIDALAKKRKSAMIKIEKLEAVEESIQFGDITTGEQGDSSAMQQQMRRMMGNDPRMAKMMKTKPPVTLTIEVKADWKLGSAEEAEQLLVAADNLKQKISDADIGGANEEEELSEEQQELAEEMAEMMNQYGNNATSTAGTPTFRFGRVVNAEDYDKLLTEAFKSARSKAKRLAAATGFELGEARLVKDAGNELSEAQQMRMSYGYGGSTTVLTNNTLADGSMEVFASSPNQVELPVRVAVTYSIKQ